MSLWERIGSKNYHSSKQYMIDQSNKNKNRLIHRKWSKQNKVIPKNFLKRQRGEPQEKLC